MTDVIQMTREELDALIDERVKKGIAANAADTKTNTLRAITERKVEVRMIDERVVIGYRNRGTTTRPVYIYEKQDPMNPKETLAFVDLILEAKEGKDQEIMSVNFKEFRAESIRAICRVTKTREEAWTIDQGTVEKKTVDPSYNIIEEGYNVPAEVMGKTRVFTVEIPREFGGPREVSVSELFVNIA